MLEVGLYASYMLQIILHLIVCMLLESNGPILYEYFITYSTLLNLLNS